MPNFLKDNQIKQKIETTLNIKKLLHNKTRKPHGHHNIKAIVKAGEQLMRSQQMRVNPINSQTYTHRCTKPFIKISVVCESKPESSE